MLSLLLAALLSAPPAPVPVKAVTAEIIIATRLDDPDGVPPRTFLLVQARGEVGSSGWSNARLVELGDETSRGIGPAKDGYLEFRLVADPPPGGRAMDVVRGVSAAKFGEIRVVPGVLKGVRVRGSDTVVDTGIEGLGAAERDARIFEERAAAERKFKKD